MENTELDACGPHATQQPTLIWKHLPALQGPSPNTNKNELAEVLSALRMEQARGRRNLMLALGEREQFNTECLSRMEKYQESQIGTITLQLTLLTRRLQREQ